MEKLGCEMCMDLMPLVRDGVASEDSVKAVTAHLEVCEECRKAYDEAYLPDGNRDAVLAGAVKRVKRATAAAVAAFVLMGIVLCELVFRGSSFLFLLAVLAVRELLRVASGEGAGWKSWVKRSLAAVLALALTGGLLGVVNALVGNPYAKKIATVAAEGYLEGKFPGQDLYIADVWHDSKQAEYEFEVRSETSVDTRFELTVRPDGRIRFDTYDDVLRGHNTAERLNGAYQELAEPVLKLLNLTHHRAYVSADLGWEFRQWGNDPYEQEYLLNGQPLEIDGVYDVLTLGKNIGVLDISIEEDTVSAEKAAEVLLEVRRLMDEAGLPFRCVDLTLEYPRPEDPQEGRKKGRLVLEGFSRDDIREEGLVQRVRDAELSEG